MKVGQVVGGVQAEARALVMEVATATETVVGAAVDSVGARQVVVMVAARVEAMQVVASAAASEAEMAVTTAVVRADKEGLQAAREGWAVPAASQAVAAAGSAALP